MGLRWAMALALGLSVAAGALQAQDEAPAGAPAAPATGGGGGQPPDGKSPDAKSQDDKSRSARPKSAKQKDRVFPKDLEGTWIARAYADKLARTRSPRAAAAADVATAIKIQRDNHSYPMLITNFRRAVLQAIIDIQPDRKPKSYRLAVAKEDTGVVYSSDLSFIYFRGERGASGVFETLSIAEPHFSKRRFVTYQRLAGDLENFINRTVIAGRYRDAQGASYEFSESGEARLPDRTFAYEVTLDPSAAKCDLLTSHTERAAEGKERIGFGWKGDTLQLFKVSGSKAPLACEARPFAELTRQ